MSKTEKFLESSWEGFWKLTISHLFINFLKIFLYQVKTWIIASLCRQLYDIKEENRMGDYAHQYMHLQIPSAI